MKVIVVGCGRVGSTLARQLDSEGHEVSIVDLRAEAFSRLGNSFGGEMIVGTGVDQALLRRAGIEKADAFVAVTNGDNRNIMSAQIAKTIFNVPRVITRIYDPIREEAYRNLGLETICSTTIGSRLMHDYIVTGANRAHDLLSPPSAAGQSGTEA